MKKSSLFIMSITSLFLSSCAAPVIIVGGGALLTVPFKKKGVSGTISDTSITTSINAKIYDWNSKAFTQVDVDVYNGEVLLTGLVDETSFATKVEELTWKVEGVRAVYNHILTEKNTLTDYTSDTWITTKIKTKLLTDSNIHNLNYSIKTVAGTTYVIGTAENQKELDTLHDIIRNTSGVKKVVSYATLSGQQN